MKRKLFFACSLLFSVIGIRAQENKFRIGIGYQRTWVVDQQASPLKYQTSEKTIMLGYTHTGMYSKFNVKLNGALGRFFPTGFQGRQFYDPGYNPDGTPKKDSGSMVGTFYNANIDIGYVQQISTGYSKYGNNDFNEKHYAGGSLSNQLFYGDNIVRAAWMNSTSLNGVYEYTAALNTKHFFDIKITIPLFARNTRLPYHNTVASPDGDGHVKTLFKQGSRFAWPGSFQNIRIDAGYEYLLNKNVGLGLHYFGQWLRYGYERPISLFQNNISLTASIQ